MKDKNILAIAVSFFLLFASGCSVRMTQKPASAAPTVYASATAAFRAAVKTLNPTVTPVPTATPTAVPTVTPVIVLTPDPTPVPETPIYEWTAPTVPVYTGALSEYGVFAPSDPSMRLAVPNVRQDWEPWKLRPYANTSSAIEMMGCSLTSLTMILRYYGLDTDPGEMNDWLLANGGFAGYGAIVWSKAVERVPGLRIFGSYSYPDGADLAFIKEVIDRGFPVLAEVHYKGTSHYVVLCGYNATTFYVNDPWYENPGHTLDRTVMQGNLAVAYDDNLTAASTIKSIIVFVTSSPTPSKILTVDVRSDFIPDPNGWLVSIRMPNVRFIAGDANMYVNGKAESISAAPVRSGDTLLIPLGALMLAMGGQSTFEPGIQKMTAVVQNRNLEIWAGIRTAFNNSWFFDQLIPPRYAGGDLLVSADALVLQLGYHLSWNPADGSVTLTE